MDIAVINNMEKNYEDELVKKILSGEINFVEYDAKRHVEKKGFVRTEFLLSVVDVEGSFVPVVDAKIVSGTDGRIYSETLWPFRNATPENLELLELGAIDTFNIHIDFVIKEKDGKKVIHESTPMVSSVVCSGNTIRFSGEKRAPLSHNDAMVKIIADKSSSVAPDDIRNYLTRNGVEHFYHFTDRRNLESIISHGGLFSWKYCLDHNISIPNAGGSEESRSLDLKYGLEDYVRLSFCDDHPMAWRLKQQGADLVLLKIKIDVAWRLQDTMFSDINATDSSHHHGNKLSDLQRVDLNATKQHFVSSSDSAFKKHQAEILVKTFIPLKYIENIDNPITLFDGSDYRFKNNDTARYRYDLLDELPF